MNKIFLFLFLCCFASLNAQNIKFNPKLGFGFYDIAFSEDQEIDGKLMLTIGSDLRVGSKSLFFNTGLHFSTDGFTDDGNTFEDNGSFSFLRVPTQLGWYLYGREKNLAIILKGGLTHNFYLFQKNLGKDASDLIKKYNLATTFGLGTDIFKFVHVGLDIDLGLTNYFDFDPIDGRKVAVLFNIGATF
jgi:hypothetical protein